GSAWRWPRTHSGTSGNLAAGVRVRRLRSRRMRTTTRITTRIALALGLCIAPLTLLGCVQAPTLSVPGQIPSPAPTAEGSEVPTCPKASVKVSDADELQDALDDAEPGEVIRLADGRYDARFEIENSGTRDEPIWLCGSAKAVLDGGNPKKG